jgi:uncharacterized membrane protein YgcG
VEDNIAPKVRYLEEEVGAGHEGAADIILKQPTMLGYSIEDNLRPTLRFLSENFPDTNAAKLVCLAGYSLAYRLVPRVRLLERHGKAGRFAASTMAQWTPAEFCQKVGITEEEYAAEVAACVREHAEKLSIPEALSAGLEAGAAAAAGAGGGGGGGGGGGSGTGGGSGGGGG